MKLDRNTNKDKTGKYALIKLRRVLFLEKADPAAYRQIMRAMHVLRDHKVIHYGDENGEPGEQFFVMKYKDKFTAPALFAYHVAVKLEAKRIADSELDEYAREMLKEANSAFDFGWKVPQ